MRRKRNNKRRRYNKNKQRKNSIKAARNMSYRMKQINELLKSELANLISRNVLVENCLITVTYVKCSPNLLEATIGISILPENMSGTALKNIKKYNKEFYQSLKRKLSIKHIPKFNWKIDSQERYAAEIDKIIKEINS